MCVLTFIPIENNGYILTSNRDEAVARIAAIPPKKYIVNQKQIFFPKDPQGGGTWIASSENFSLCLLNGGFEKHISQPPYKKSRGKVILDFFEFGDVENFFNNYEFDRIEPFTLVIIEKKEGLFLTEIRWTGEEKLLKKLSSKKPQIWSSVTLYSHEIIQKRKSWFEEFIMAENDISLEKIIHFHHFGGGIDEENSIKMNRNNILKTVSITQFEVNEYQKIIRYEDLLLNKTYQYRVFQELADFVF